MRIGQMAESGSNRRPDFYDELHKRKKRDMHTAEELAKDTGAKDRSVIFRGFKGLILPVKEKKDGKHQHFFLEEDLQWLENEIAEGRVYPVRAAQSQPVGAEKRRETISELVEACNEKDFEEALVDIQDNQTFRKQFRKTKAHRDNIVDLLQDITEQADHDMRVLAEAGKLASRLSESIGQSQMRADLFQEKKK